MTITRTLPRITPHISRQNPHEVTQKSTDFPVASTLADFYHNDPDKAEDMFQRCLLCGASYSLFPHPPEEVWEVIDCYRPLVEKLYGGTWLLAPKPLDLPTGVEGNIFRGESGSILISIVSTGTRVRDDEGLRRNLALSTRFSGTETVSGAVSLGTHYRGQRRVKLNRVDGRLELVVPEHGAATVIELNVGERRK